MGKFSLTRENSNFNQSSKIRNISSASKKKCSSHTWDSNVRWSLLLLKLFVDLGHWSPQRHYIYWRYLIDALNMKVKSRCGNFDFLDRQQSNSTLKISIDHETDRDNGTKEIECERETLSIIISIAQFCGRMIRNRMENNWRTRHTKSR